MHPGFDGSISLLQVGLNAPVGVGHHVVFLS